MHVQQSFMVGILVFAAEGKRAVALRQWASHCGTHCGDGRRKVRRYQGDRGL
ncbi:hypothetical protein [Rhizobium leguminosarum]|uniref:hypothetical protein n=1 Tax=Rhizobium leguminosarum TaxID=384 RepID=UPI0013F16B60|nr:hypothetical protein [Rhizobium leguminosarum]